jgi:hypothetical protein
MTLSDTSGTVGAAIDLHLRGYGASEQINLQWYDTTTSATTLQTVTASPEGSVDLPVTIPQATRGSHKLAAIGATTGATASAYVMVNPSIALRPSSGSPGTSVSVALDGYRAGETITVKWYSTATASTAVATTSASSTGSATATFNVPQAAAGSYKVEGVSASSARASTTFTVQ